MKQWTGEVALVTGASSGIGRCIAKALVEDGMRVVACARRGERLEALAGECQGLAGELWPIVCDLRDTDQIPGMFEEIRKRWGGVRVMVNNAGFGYREPLLSGETARWREILEVNVLALCVCTREAVADMRRTGDRGHVIHLSSMSAHRVPGGSGLYSASKFAVRSLTEGLRLELREIQSAIRVTALSPGFVETEFAEVYSGDAQKARETYERYPVLQPEDIASTLRHVLSAPPHMQIHDVLLRPTEQPS
ncbi:MAG: SDR family NAD(P)-dependent oxidoreductase [Myxococcota bacterium]|nr:SDR family NAD(P)-dependent oxidoreductase [Myxococcota bacterium]